MSSIDPGDIHVPTAVEPKHGSHRFGKYNIIAKLGEGGMGAVYLAIVRGAGGFNKLLVLKTLRDHLADNTDAVEMFLNEARISARFSHQNIVQTNEVIEVAGRHAIVMEYIDGKPLAAILSTKSGKLAPLPLGLHLRAIADALKGLQYAHDATGFDGAPLNLVHRDVSPHNIFVSYDGAVKVLDFGIAKAADSSTQTESGIIKGKVKYMAPEQMVGKSVDARADLFAVGVVLWRALTGRALWEGEPDIAIMNEVVNGRIPSPLSVNPDVPPRLNEICIKALALQREDRYPTAEAFENDLEDELQRMARNGEPTTNRELGKFLMQRFSADRDHMRAIVEERMSASSALRSRRHDGDELGDSGVVDTGELWNLPGSRQGIHALEIPARTVTLSTADGSGSGARVDATGLGRPPASRLRFGVAVSILTVIPFAIYFFAGTRAQTPPALASDKLNVPADASISALESTEQVSAPPGSAAGTSVAVAADAAPPRAEVPLSALPRGEEPRRGAKAVPSGGARAGRPGLPAGSPKEPEARPTAPANTASNPCASPLYFDERGLKMYKPECL